MDRRWVLFSRGKPSEWLLNGNWACFLGFAFKSRVTYKLTTEKNPLSTSGMVVTRRQTVSASSTPPPNMPETTPLLPKSGETSHDGGRRTISYEESLTLLPWQTDNDYIRHGYRRATPSIRKCLWSAVSCKSILGEVNYHINIFAQTFTMRQVCLAFLWMTTNINIYFPAVNIHSHSIGAAFFLSLLPLHLIPTHFPTFGQSCNPLPTPPTLHDKVALSLYLICAVSCLSLSSWFHTVSCHSREVCDAAHRGDYVGY